ncbi:hypothetical protein SAMN02745194_01311 [Roseomonas rosea]|uniref:Uncharacterized protein n=1 Tax=Muricoccus roseus TaxID=198092 RepID=A0A1M6EWV6_9PROT|nr:DUF6212 domain-containing protein [Roseomonas rosea]SHI89920.1 hypothetical protein SAMN02745194_01311 [Roseomonas rosea]
MTLRADPSHLPRLAAGQPMVMVAEGVMDPSPLAAPALEVWMVSNRSGASLLHPHGTRAPDPEAAVPLPTPPMGTLALVASERLRIAPLTRWWTEASGLPAPPFLLAPTGQAAMPGLIALLADSLAAAARRESEALQAVTAARQEMEETREAMADTVRLLAHRPPAAPRLVLSGEEGEAAPITGAARHKLGTGLAGLAAIAVHLAGPATGHGLLRLRLLAAESDRVVGSWAIPAAELAPGWLTLDLPTPLGPLHETAVLEVIPEGDGLPALSREARWAGTEGEHPLALRAWAGAPGSRYLAPAHWMPEEVGLALPPTDIPLSLPAASWEAALPLEGQAEMIALGEEMPRPLLRAAAKGRAILLLPHIHAAGLDRVRIAFSAARGTGASVAAWVHAVDAAPSDAATLDRLGTGGAMTGWRAVPEEGLELTLPLSARLSGRASLVIGLQAGDEDASAEVSGVTLSAIGMGEALPAAPAQAVAPAPAVAPVQAPRATLPPQPAAAPPAPPAAIPATPAVPSAASPFAPAAPGPQPAAPPTVPPAPALPAASTQPPAPPAAIPVATAAPAARPVASPPAAPVMPAPLKPTPAAPAPQPAPLPAPPVRVVAPTPAPQAVAPAAAPAAGPRLYAPPTLQPPPMPRPVGEPAPAPEPARPAVAPLTPTRPATPPVRATPTNVAPGRAPARFEAVRLHQHLPGESYRHLDMTVASLASGPMRWASVRLKLASKDGEARLEFRQAAGWPHMFRDWLGRASDKFGPFLRVSHPELREFLDSIKDERDAAMMQALFAVLPRAAEDAARQAGLSVADTAQWSDTAKSLQDEGLRSAP